MAQAFLSQLLRVENSVQPSSSERCIICFTECGTLCPESGVVEWELCLPCNHKVGSRCIAIWLDPTGAAKNSCPVCRYVFFPVQPRPYLEHGIIEDDQNDRVDLDRYDFPEGPNFNPDSAPRSSFNHQWNNIDWAAVHVEDNASIIVLEHNSPGPSSEWAFDRLYGGEEDVPASPAYSPRSLNNTRRSPINQDFEHLGDDGVDIPASLDYSPRSPDYASRPPVNLEHLDNDGAADDELEMDEEAVDEEENATRDSDLRTVKIMCETYCYRLSLDSSSSAIDISQRIAEKIHVGCLRVGHSAPSIAAVSVFVASHLMGTPKTPHWVSMMSGVDAEVISGMYSWIYSARARVELIDEEMLAMIDRGDGETVLGFLPNA